MIQCPTFKQVSRPCFEQKTYHPLIVKRWVFRWGNNVYLMPDSIDDVWNEKPVMVCLCQFSDAPINMCKGVLPKVGDVGCDVYNNRLEVIETKLL